MKDNNKKENVSNSKARVEENAKAIIQSRSGSTAEYMSNRSGRSSKSIEFTNMLGLGPESKGNKVTNKIILESSPTLSRGMEIVAGLIACPSGGTSTALYYESLTGDTTSLEDAEAVVNVIETHFREKVKLQNTVYASIHNMITTDGADVEMYIPSNMIGRLVDAENEERRAALESESKPIGHLLRSGTIRKTEPSKPGDKLPKFTYDLNVLNRTSDALTKTEDARIALEAEKSPSKGLRKQALSIFRQRNKLKASAALELVGYDPLQPSVGTSIKRLPAEAVFPIYLSGIDNEPYRYIVLLDENFLPISVDTDGGFNDLANADNTQEQTNQLKTLGKELNLNTNSNDGKTSILAGIHKQFISNVTTDIYNALSEGTFADEYAIDNDTQLIDIAFQRFLAVKETRMLVVPPEQLSYITLLKDAHGIGESIIARSKNINLLHVVMFYAKFLQNLDEATPKVELAIELDEDDLDQNKTVEMAVNEAVNSRGGKFNWNFKGAQGLMDNISNSGVRVKVSGQGDNGDMPRMDIEVNDGKRSKEKIDNDFLEHLTKLTTQKIGLGADMIDDSYKPEFSAQVSRNSDITARQMSGYVMAYNEGISERVVKRVLNDDLLIKQCLDVIKEKDATKAEVILREVLIHLQVTLPEDNMNALESKLDDVKSIMDGIDDILEAILGDWITDGYDASGAEFTSDMLENARDILKGGIIREYVKRNSSLNGLLTEIASGETLNEIIKNEVDFKAKVAESISEASKGVAFDAVRFANTKAKLEAKVEGKMAEDEVKRDKAKEEADAKLAADTPAEEPAPEEGASDEVAPAEETAPVEEDAAAEETPAEEPAETEDATTTEEAPADDEDAIEIPEV